MQGPPIFFQPASYSLLQGYFNPLMETALKDDNDFEEYLRYGNSQPCIEFFAGFWMDEDLDAAVRLFDRVKLLNEQGKVVATTYEERGKPYKHEQFQAKVVKRRETPINTPFYLSPDVEDQCQNCEYCRFEEGQQMPAALSKNASCMLFGKYGTQYIFKLQLEAGKRAKKQVYTPQYLSVGLIKGRTVLGFEKAKILGGNMHLVTGGYYKQYGEPGSFLSFALNFLIFQATGKARIRKLSITEREVEREIFYAS